MANVRPPSSGELPPSQHEPRDRAGSLSQGMNNLSLNAPGRSSIEKSDPAAAADTNGQRDAGAEQDDGAPRSETPRPHQLPPPTAANPEVNKQVEDVLKSEIGVSTLLNRLKQSIASAKEFALFLKKRSVLEEEHANGMKKLCRMTQESMHRPEHRGGSFAQSYDEMMFIHDRMAENGLQFAMSLHQMHEDLIELATNAERNRKTWKANGLSAEQRVADMDTTMRKSKAKYDALAEEYERARTGEPRQGGKVFSLKPKSAAQQEEDLLKKVQNADQTYLGHVLALQSEKSQLETSTRPEAIRSLQDSVKETDSGLLLQMQKFAAFNEKLLLSNGLIISPIKGPGGDGNTPQSRSLRQAVSSVDNDRDLNDFVSQHHGKIQPDFGDVKYERHPALNPQPSPLSSQPSSFSQPPSQQQPQQQGFNQQQPPMGQGPPPGQYPQQSFNAAPRNSMGSFPSGRASSPQQGIPPQHSMQSQMSPPYSPQAPPGGGPDPARFAQPHNRSFSQGNMQPPPSSNQLQHNSRSHVQPGPPTGSQGAPQLGALSFQNNPPPQQQQQPPYQPGQYPPEKQPGGPGAAPQYQPPSQDGRGSGFTSPHDHKGPLSSSPPPPHIAGAIGGPPQAASPPANPVFGVSLNRLYERDGLAVPMVVYQCIQAVDLFGLGVEGIYRQSGSVNHIHQLKAMFDTDAQSPKLDFRNPDNFFHDVNSVTGLLKQFFRDLPDPLLTKEHHAAFINAAKNDDDIVRRDSLHAIINSLPDPNYATLRAMALHLFRVTDASHVNRMTSTNLALIFGPTLMGSDASTAMADTNWQSRVIDTILQNTYQIFDED